MTQEIVHKLFGTQEVKNSEPKEVSLINIRINSQNILAFSYLHPNRFRYLPERSEKIRQIQALAEL